MMARTEMSCYGGEVSQDRHVTLDDLPPKRQDFVLAYLGEAQGNASEAARIAGYKHPGTEGHRLLQNAEVSAVVDSIRAEAMKRGIASFEEGALIMSETMRGRLGEPMTGLDGTPVIDDHGNVLTVTKPTDRVAAFKALAKVMGWESARRHEVAVATLPVEEMTPEEAKKVVLLHRGQKEAG